MVLERDQQIQAADQAKDFVTLNRLLGPYTRLHQEVAEEMRHLDKGVAIPFTPPLGSGRPAMPENMVMVERIVIGRNGDKLLMRAWEAVDAEARAARNGVTLPERYCPTHQGLHPYNAPSGVMSDPVNDPAETFAVEEVHKCETYSVEHASKVTG